MKKAKKQVKKQVKKQIEKSYAVVAPIDALLSVSKRTAESLISTYLHTCKGLVWDRWIPSKELKVIVSYPLNSHYMFTIIKPKSKQMTIAGIAWKIAQIYKSIYENPNKYGVWGHDIQDLTIESITIVGNKVYTSVSS